MSPDVGAAVTTPVPPPRLPRWGARPAVATAAITSAVAGLIHIAAARNHEGDHFLLWLFILCAAAQLGWAAAVLRWPTRPVLTLGLLLNGGALLTWTLTRTVGISFVDALAEVEDVGRQDLGAATFAALAVVGAILTLVRPLVVNVLRAPWIAILATFAMGSALPALSASHVHEHGHGHGHDHTELAAGHEHGDDGHGGSGDHAHDGDGDHAHEAGDDHGHDDGAGHDGDHGHGGDEGHDEDHGDDEGHGHDGGTADGHDHGDQGVLAGHDHSPGGSTGGHDHSPGGSTGGHDHPSDPTSPTGGHDHPDDPEHPDDPDDGHEHPDDPTDPEGPITSLDDPRLTSEQFDAAIDLIVTTTAGMSSFVTVEDVVAAGYVSIGDGGAPGEYEHFINWSYLSDPYELDPTRIESVVMKMNADGTSRVVSAMYILSLGKTIDDVPDIAGSLTTWHDHDNLCFDGTQLVGLAVNGVCSQGFLIQTPPMMHVWIESNPCGPFAGIDEHGLACDATHEH